MPSSRPRRRAAGPRWNEPGAGIRGRSAGDVRLPVVWNEVDDALPGRSGGLGTALPGLPRPGRRQPVPPIPVAGCADGSRGGGRRPATRSRAPARAGSAGPGPRRRDDRLLRSPGRRVRRLVPAPRPLRPRAHPRRGLGRGARRRRNVARRPADPRRDRGACRGHRVVVAAPRVQGRALDLRRGGGTPRAGSRAARRPPPPRPPPRPRRVGRAGPPGRRRCSSASG